VPRHYVTPQLHLQVPPALIEAARSALGLADSAPRGVVIRTALAASAGVSLDAYPMGKRGPKPRRRSSAA